MKFHINDYGIISYEIDDSNRYKFDFKLNLVSPDTDTNKLDTIKSNTVLSNSGLFDNDYKMFKKNYDIFKNNRSNNDNNNIDKIYVYPRLVLSIREEFIIQHKMSGHILFMELIFKDIKLDSSYLCHRYSLLKNASFSKINEEIIALTVLKQVLAEKYNFWFVFYKVVFLEHIQREKIFVDLELILRGDYGKFLIVNDNLFNSKHLCFFLYKDIFSLKSRNKTKNIMEGYPFLFIMLDSDFLENDIDHDWWEAQNQDSLKLREDLGLLNYRYRDNINKLRKVDKLIRSIKEDNFKIYKFSQELDNKVQKWSYKTYFFS